MNGAIMGDSQEMGESKKVNVLRADQYNLCTPSIKLYFREGVKKVFYSVSLTNPPGLTVSVYIKLLVFVNYKFHKIR